MANSITGASASTGGSGHTGQSWTRWLALYLLCAGVLMIVLDSTIVTVALGSMETELRLTGASTSWLLNAYTVPFSGFLLLGGRLGDLCGQRRVFVAGIAVFTLASLACSLARSLLMLVFFRALQGLGGAVVTAVSLSLIAKQFPLHVERAKALGIYGFVCATGGGLGEVLGGVLTQLLGWRWIFLINVPLGLSVCALCVRLIPEDIGVIRVRHINAFSSITVTAASTLLVSSSVSVNDHGGLAFGTLLAATAAILFCLFVAAERRASQPLVPLELFRLPNFTVSNSVAAMWSAGVFAWFVIFALYLQRVLGYDALEVGLAFVPTQVIIAACALGVAARVVVRFGVRRPLCVGLVLTAVGIAQSTRLSLNGSFMHDILPSMMIVGLGAGMTSAPLLLLALNGVRDADSGAASGVLNTASIMGTALGLAILSSLADFRTNEILRQGVPLVAAVAGGYHAALIASALITALAALLGLLGLRSPPVVSAKVFDPQ